MKKKNKIIALKPSSLSCWRYESNYGVVAVYANDKKDLTLERALWLIEKAKKSLLE